MEILTPKPLAILPVAPLRSASAPSISTTIAFPSKPSLTKEISTPLGTFETSDKVIQTTTAPSPTEQETKEEPPNKSKDLKCSLCRVSKPADAFSKNQKKKKASARKCNDCVSGVNKNKSGTPSTPSTSAETKTAETKTAEPDEYFTQLSKERVRTTTFDATHSYFAQAKKDESSKRTNTKKIAKELKNLKKYLPIHRDASIFIRFDKNKPFLMRALVSGPPGTPYESGLFAFDLYCPPTYPEVPPKCVLLTTGKGTVRFSPNLYREGKVCLSLLGTWQGPGWDPKVSSLLQVLISIQALVFVENPHSMEPGFGGWGEGASKIKSMTANCKSKDTKKTGRVPLAYMEQQCKNNDQTDNWGGSDPAGTIRQFILSAKDCITKAGSGTTNETKEAEVDYEKFLGKHYLNIEGTRYNARIHAGTAAWAIYDMMSKPLVEFKNVIEKHFEIKKDYLNKQLNEWVKKDVALPHRQKQLIATYKQIQAHLKADRIVEEETKEEETKEEETKEEKPNPSAVVTAKSKSKAKKKVSVWTEFESVSEIVL